VQWCAVIRVCHKAAPILAPCAPHAARAVVAKKAGCLLLPYSCHIMHMLQQAHATLPHAAALTAPLVPVLQVRAGLLPVCGWLTHSCQQAHDTAFCMPQR
jgi:hypothetical protein